VSDLNNIEKLFQEQFENFEMPVRAELWSQVAAGACVGKTVFWTTSKIVAAAFVGLISVTAITWFAWKGAEESNTAESIDLVKENTELSPETFIDDNNELSTDLKSTVSSSNTVVSRVDSPAEIPNYFPPFFPNLELSSPSGELDLPIVDGPIVEVKPNTDNDAPVVPPALELFTPAPEVLNLELLIAPEKTQEKTLEQIHFPQEFIKVFVPSLSGEAGQFSVYSEDLGSFKIEIRTRAGKLVYTSTDPNFIWRGEQMDGSEAPEGTYMYTIFSTTSSGESIKPQAGSVFLMRK
jgi:hypothetical protein